MKGTKNSIQREILKDQLSNDYGEGTSDSTTAAFKIRLN